MHNQGFAQITPETIERGIRETLARALQVVRAKGGGPEMCSMSRTTRWSVA